ncbi:MAG: threonine--tRNA ligase [Alphaproteobacteria bacterium]|nr:threonine--tRNA ligase [Alphaproteobacteria bacterium]MCK5659454.1 threonine--tRNA ligase [Alphaproteobacteria bacterium]
MKPVLSELAESQVIITLPDGKTLTFEGTVTGFDIAGKIGPGLAKAALAIKLNGEMMDLRHEISSDAKIEIVTRSSPDALELIRHGCAHVLAEAVQQLFLGTQVTIGPNVENGFYYDFARETPFTTDDFFKIEEKMREIISKDEPFVREVWSRDDAIKHFNSIGENYKVEIIQDLLPMEDISIYRQGKWLDLCKGPHLPSTRHIGNAFKLMKVAGAYWRGDSSNTMLSRIYGTVWRDQKELDAHLLLLEEAEKRDHRKIGREMDLFHLQEDAHGSVFWHDKGFCIWKVLEQYIRKCQEDFGYTEVKTPQLMNSRFWEASGHWSKYRENMFVVPDVVPNIEEGGKVFKEEPKDFLALKPMNCPGHVQIFKQGIKSYRDLPIRMAEFGCCHRNEPHGALHGLMRVRQMTQDDAHIFCREDQILSETSLFIEMFIKTYKDFGFDDVQLKIATRPSVRAGTDETWDKSEKSLISAIESLKNKYNLKYVLAPGEGAFYGPKLEFHVKDAIGRSWQCATLQTDFVMSQKLDATYIGEDGKKHYPVMLHRAVYGSFERFIGMLIEAYAGKFPLWLAPVQAVVATITSDADSYAEKVMEQLKKAGIRAESDLRNEKINYKIREHSLVKTPQIWVVGKREAKEGTVAIRRLGSDAQEILALDEAIRKIGIESASPQ